MNKQPGVYVIKSPSGKRYIGSSQNIARRWTVHKFRLRRGDNPCRGLQHAADKYGLENLKFEVLEFCQVQDLIAAEQRHLDATDRSKLYNGRLVAESNRGWRHTAAGRAAMSAGHRRRGAKRTAEHKAIISRTHRGKTNSDDTRKRISASKSSTGLEGVHRLEGRNAWTACVFMDGVRYRLGQCPSPEEAQALREKFLADPAAWLAAKPKKSDSGFRGVCYDKARRKWRASYRGQYLGLYPTPEAASAARAAYLTAASCTIPQEPLESSE